MKRVLIIIWLAVLAGCGSDQRGAEHPSPESADWLPLHDIRQLMLVVLDTQADVYWDASGTVIDESGVHDEAPVDDEGWMKVQSAAAILGEMGNVMQLRQFSQDRGADWMEFSKALAVISKEAEQAAIDRNKDEVLRVGHHIYSVCVACHQAYEAGAYKKAP